MNSEGSKRMRILIQVVGVGLLVAGIFVGVWTWKFTRGAAIAEGVVIHLNHGGSHPEIKFITASGQVIDYPQGGFIFGYHPGDRVRVLYNPQNPIGTACLDKFGALWFTTMLLSVLGGFFLAGASLKIVEF